ncbi:outer membrane scaffolding protein for murein synthesis (MipA/OmpV family) [Sphingobium sp. B2D3A]|uniref:MipA/OmpV family protein n=1 Tax=unclassified Sphingobium TaxID=2611147 RepID=UPI00222534D2|nr:MULTISPECIES: MipA/OmpV family protein [unclassified Sphingobium]MCW2336900.1 outer membrane scaffolding protein for murein synthesis (MipA/OmpV family) [Sphingobium sp. B2D3A]MCW2386654.1 outer membrane scaffolding protein for murein synthesis (MipA/OmpV family) [Sphingobium sp. B2D3D]
MSAPALGQTTTAASEAAEQREAARARAGDRLTIGLGAAVIREYEGANGTSITPVPGAVGKLGGLNFLYVGNRASIDLINDGGSRWDFQLGPVATIGLNRTNVDKIDDERIRALGKVGTSVELGGYAGIARWGLITSNYDRLSATVTARKDVAGAHGGTIITPSVSYMTPLSTKSLAVVSFSANHVDGDYAGTYFSITPAQSAASTLPVYTAGSGWKDWTLAAAGNIALTGDLSGGLSLVGGVAYTRLLGDIADSPVVRLAGSRNQWMFGAGLAYTF